MWSGFQWIRAASNQTLASTKIPLNKTRSTAKFTVTTDSNHAFILVPDLLDQDCTDNGPNRKWSGNFFYFATIKGYQYTSIMINLCTRHVVNYPKINRMKCYLPIWSLNAAAALRHSPKGYIHRTDFGSQYYLNEHQSKLSQYECLLSMSGKRRCY